jgi:hypothetical protein
MAERGVFPRAFKIIAPGKGNARRGYHRFLPSMTTTSTVSSSKSSNRRELMLILGLSKSGSPVRGLGEGAAATNRAESVLDGLRAPTVEAHIFRRAGQLELVGRVVGPERATLRTEGAGALRHRLRRFRYLERRSLAVTASLDDHFSSPCHARLKRNTPQREPPDNLKQFQENRAPVFRSELRKNKELEHFR